MSFLFWTPDTSCTANASHLALYMRYFMSCVHHCWMDHNLHVRCGYFSAFLFWKHCDIQGKMNCHLHFLCMLNCELVVLGGCWRFFGIFPLGSNIWQLSSTPERRWLIQSSSIDFSNTMYILIHFIVPSCILTFTTMFGMMSPGWWACNLDDVWCMNRSYISIWSYQCII